MVVAVGGVEENVRLIGIDTPESVARDRPDECFGAEAPQRLAELLPPGTVVRLTRDVEPRDVYDRLLAYVQRRPDGLFVNAAQVGDGYADRQGLPAQHHLPRRPRAGPSAPPAPPAGGCGRRAAAPTRRWRARPAPVTAESDRSGPASARPLASTSMVSLAERLGRPADARLLIVTADALGSSHAANVGVYEALREGIATSASLMVPCPWAREAASRYRGEDVGVELTLNAEHDLYRWGPITQAPSLLDGDGGFPRTVADLWDHADLDEVRRELRAQVERAILWGFDVSHLDSHLGALQAKPEFFDVLLDLAVDFGLPVRLPSADRERSIGFPLRSLAADEGVVAPDRFVRVSPVGSRRAIERLLADLPPGVTEVHVRPAVDTPELRAQTARLAGAGRRPRPGRQRPQPRGPCSAGSAPS